MHVAHVKLRLSRAAPSRADAERFRGHPSTAGRGSALASCPLSTDILLPSSALIHVAGQLQVAAQNALAASAAKHYEGRGAVRAALGRGNPELSGLVPAVTAPDSLTIRSGSLRRMSRRPGAKGRRDRLSSVFPTPRLWGQGLFAGAHRRHKLHPWRGILGEIRRNPSGRTRFGNRSSYKTRSASDAVAGFPSHPAGESCC